MGKISENSIFYKLYLYYNLYVRYKALKKRSTYSQNEEDLFFLVPLENDGSQNWSRLQEWLDAGNSIADDMPNQNTHYIAERKAAYPALADQLDKIFHEGVDAWKVEIQAIKDANPKPPAPPEFEPGT